MRGFTMHTVRPNDTIYSIARQYGSDVNRILFSNPNLDIYNLLIGNKVKVPFGDIVPTDVRYPYELMNMNILSLQNLYPFIEVMDIGNSVLGRPILSLKIGTGPKEVFYNASFHANEWITSVVLMKFVEDYARAIATNDTISGYLANDIYQTTTLYVVPMVNPDGVDLVTSYLTPSSTGYQTALSISQRLS